jgi:Ca-activated chloride channel family protein
VAVLCAVSCLGAVAAASVLTWLEPDPAAMPPLPTAPPVAGGPSTPARQGPTAAGSPVATQPSPGPASQTTDGALQLADGTLCPLTHTDVKAVISGFIARVTVTQQFVNPTSDRVEAVYTFPLPQHAAVDDLTMTTGGRVVRGVIARREEARRLYERAREAGHTAALLEQERPNIFTQSVANIPPQGPVTIEISYVDLLDYDEGRYAFVFPMVVGPRYVPGSPTGTSGGGWSPDTTRVPDASRITPPVAGVHVGQKGTRAGHDIALSVTLDAGVPIESIDAISHETAIERPTARTATVRLLNEQEIPNRDFVLTYDTSGNRIQDALLAHAPAGPAGGGAFALILQPPDRVPEEDVTSRELVFVLDTSGSMNGYPIETARAVMRRAIASLRAGDTFNLITFAGHTRVLFRRPVAPTVAHVEQALAWLDGQAGAGGTEMMAAIRAALGDAEPGIAVTAASAGEAVPATTLPDAPVRIVCFMTDGYVGNDMEIIGEIQKHPHARVFSFGIGSSVNRFLLDGMAQAGRGEVEYVTRADDAEAAANRFYERVHTPVLTDISVDWGTLPVEQLTPARIPDLFAARPLILLGRYRQASSGVVTLRGTQAGRPFTRRIDVTLPAAKSRHETVSQLWARRRIGELMARDWTGAQRGTPAPDLQEQITQLGLDFRLMTPYTSFIAVEEQVVVEAGRRRTIQVPVDMPHNVSAEGVFGEMAKAQAISSAVRVGGTVSPSAAAVVPGGVVGGIVGGVPSAPPSPALPLPVARQRPQETITSADAARRPSAIDTTLAAKLHVSLLEIVECSQPLAARRASAPDCQGKEHTHVEVKVVLAATAGPDLVRRLEQAGLELTKPAGGDRNTARVVTGRIAVGQLAKLAALAEVTLIASAGVGGDR